MTPLPTTGAPLAETGASTTGAETDKVDHTGPGPVESELGAIFTRPWVAELVLDLAGYTDDKPLHSHTILEPSCGNGAFVTVIVARLLASAARDQVAPDTLLDAVIAYDLDPAAVATCRDTVRAQLAGHGLDPGTADRLATHWICEGDFLKTAPTLPPVTWVVGNPPYVRIEDVARSTMAEYRRNWTTMSGRADVYVGFFEAGLSKLDTDGRLAYICADRWMRNRYGAALRTLVENHHTMETCLVMHSVDAFEDRVAAYPAITVITSGDTGGSLVAEATVAFDAAAAGRLLKARSRGPAPIVVDDAFRATWLDAWHRGASSWPAGSPESLRLLADLEHRFPDLAETGARVSVGVATGADDVYVTTDPAAVEPQFLHPTLAARETTHGGIDWRERYLVAPWTTDGLADLADYPRLRTYLETHRPRLERRYVAKANPQRWWRTIDRVDPAVAARPKLLIPDLKDRIHPVLDQGKFVPLHSLYYVTSDTWDLPVLGGLLMSGIANMFVEAYSVRMASGYMRVSAQYLRRVRVPRPDDIPKPIVAELKAAFWNRDVARATRAAGQAYGLDEESVAAALHASTNDTPVR